MKNRNIPFGYHYENGIVAIHPDEAEALKSIFHAYLNGDSLLTIATRLNSSGTEYMPGVIGWNKARLMRIVEDDRYLGTESIPPLIDSDTLNAAKAVKTARSTQKETDRTQDIFHLNVPVICPVCGTEMRRRYDSRCKCHTRWTCRNPECRKMIILSDDDLLQQITDRLNTVIRNPDGIRIPKETEISTDIELLKLDNEISRMLNSPGTDKNALREKMLHRLSMQYRNIDHHAYTIKRMKAELECMNPITGFSAELTERTVKTITLNTDKTVSITLLNDQTIRKE